MTQEEKKLPDGLEEAAENYIAPIENDEGLDYINFNGRDIKDAFIAGAEWMKAKMLEEAVEGYVNYYEDSGGILMAEAQVGCPYHNGDKVKIIVIKED